MKSDPKASRLVLSKETVATLRIKTGVNTGVAAGGGGGVGGGGTFVSLPVKNCISNVVHCPDPPPPKPTTSALCF